MLRITGLLNEKKVGCIKKSGIKFFFTPYRDDIDGYGNLIMNVPERIEVK